MFSDDSPLAGNRKVATIAAHCVISVVLKLKQADALNKSAHALAGIHTHTHTHGLYVEESSMLIKTPLKGGFGAKYSRCDGFVCLFLMNFFEVRFFVETTSSY